MIQQVYLDFNASTPIAPEVSLAMQSFANHAYGNPSSLHWAGVVARDAIDLSRSQVAALLGCDATEVIFTSGGTESNNFAIKGLYFDCLRQGRPFHAITSRTEHPAVLEPFRFIESLGGAITYLAVDQFGSIDPDAIHKTIRPETALISIMHANNEVGTIQPIEEVSAIARKHGIPLHTDAAQSVGKILVDVDSLGVDLLTIAGHKLYATKGVGAIFVRDGIPLEPLLHGAGHEAGRRAGTENVLQIVGLGAACELAHQWIQSEQVTELRDHLWRSVSDHFGDNAVLLGHPTNRLPNTLNIGFRGQLGNEILGRLPMLAASTGSACHAGSLHMSPVLDALGVASDIGLGAIRFSLGRSTTMAEVEWVLRSLKQQIPQKQLGSFL
jgi:cysteine desulfurase